MSFAAAFFCTDLYKAWKMPKNPISRLNPRISFVILASNGRKRPKKMKRKVDDMKKFLALLLTVVMVLSLAACGGQNTDRKSVV